MTRRFALTALLGLTWIGQAMSSPQPITLDPIPVPTAWAGVLLSYPAINTWSPLEVSWNLDYQHLG
jgi:hypothetical protein